MPPGCAGAAVGAGALGCLAPLLLAIFCAIVLNDLGGPCIWPLLVVAGAAVGAILGASFGLRHGSALASVWHCLYVPVKRLFEGPYAEPDDYGLPVAREVRAGLWIPNGRLYMIDGPVPVLGAPSTERVRGAWKINENGEIEGPMIPNPNYRPSL